MALFRRFYYREPPDRLLEISERVYVFDCCFTSDVMGEDEYKVYMGGIVAQLQDYSPEACFMVFNFREGEKRGQISHILSQYDMTVMDYPLQYAGCPLLPLEMIHHFLRSSECWLSLEGQQNVLLMHCERGGWPVLAFMLAGLLLYRKHYKEEQKTLEMVYKQAPKELLHMLSLLNPQPTQLRYLQYISRRNIGSWPPSDTPLLLECLILRLLPIFKGGKGCRPLIRVYGQDPSTPANRSSKLLYSTSKTKKSIRHYAQSECAHVKIDIFCRVQGDVVIECVHLDEELEREEMMFRIAFHTAFVISKSLILNRDEVDLLWDARDQFPKDFKAEVLFMDADAVVPNLNTDTSVEDGNEIEGTSPEEPNQAANETSSLNQVDKEESDEESSQGSSDYKTTGKATPENPKTTLYEAMLSERAAANETSSLNQVDKEESDEESSQGSSDNKTATGKATLENRPKTTLLEAKLLNSVKPLTRDSTPNNVIRTTNNGWSFGAEIIAWLGVIHRLLILIGTYLHWTPGQTQRHRITFPSGESSNGATDAMVRSKVTSTNELVTSHPNQASYEYDVFLSFRGDDTRESFTGTLYHTLSRVHKVKTFMDVIFRKGSKLEELLKMIEKSRMSIVVFSENFAESEWCLKELTKIFEENDRRGHEVLPVFYKVNPSELRHQNSGKTKEHMDKHINTYGKDSDKLKTWSNAIKELGNLSGYTYRSGRGKLEVELAQEIAQEILTRLHGQEAGE